MKRQKPKLCRWCGLVTKRHCGICLDCCEKRDAYDKLIDSGKAPYVPPTERQGHRFYVRARRKPTEAQKVYWKALSDRKKGIVAAGG